jgi:uncharacterized protein YbaA (DUF1428 family)
MSRYVDAYVLPVPKDKLDDYRKMAELGAKIWKEHGALEYHECIADDVKPGKQTSFPQSVNLKPDEIVFFSYIVYKSREDRDRINALVMKDERLTGYGPDNMPFDGMRMFWGGFKSWIDA